MKYKLVIFDWDGTLMDSAPKIVACMQKAAKMAQVSIPSEHDVRQIIGVSLLPATKMLFECSDGVAEKIVAFYKDIYANQDSTPHPLFSGARELLETLKSDSQRSLAVATGKAKKGLMSAWEKSDSAHYFHSFRCADDARSKPDPEMLQQLLTEFNFHPKDAVMIGDTHFDMQMAEAIGMDRIGVSYGAHKPEQLEKHSPIAIVDSCSQLHQYL